VYRRHVRVGSRLCENVDEQRTRRIVFSLCFFRRRQKRCSFLIQLIRGKRSTRKSDFGVFTQPGSFSEVGPCDKDVRSTLNSRHRQAARSGPLRATRLAEIRCRCVHAPFVPFRATAERRELGWYTQNSTKVETMSPLTQLSSSGLPPLSHCAGAGMGRILDTRQPSGVLTST
jgi:hypothetical protein